ncbi:alpha/beta-hydrolase [Mollisia scopiformis]|uniref:Alpha/beta-hydrolase n=1 Tax=Mollisia scopiformis TaxID=149040 RepID=A0A194WT29_MOLSC|nr:alpha/beta-hydrolase [Mollisia scopiformis]KUJ11116.1 alpha/beta-hydrolase [Mollisia scopiformis]
MAAPSTEGYAPEWLEYEQALGQRPVLGGSAQDIVDQYTALGAMLATQAPPPDTSVETRDETADGVPVRIYTPPGAAGKKLPLAVYFHGGGYLVGDLNSEDPWCRVIAKSIPCIMVSVDYRLSTEHKLPVMLDDCLTAYRWARKNAADIGADQSHTISIGASAGGGLALTVADQLIKSGNKDHVQGIVAIVPVAAHPSSVPSKYASHYTAHKDNASGVPIIDWGSMETFYKTAAADPQDEKTFVTLSKNLKDFPPTYICTCGKDPLRDDGKVLEMMLKEEGVKTKSDFYEGVPHYWWMFPGMRNADKFFGNLIEGTKWVLGGGK